MSANEEIVLNVNRGDSTYGGNSSVVMGNGGGCPIGRPVASTFYSGAESVDCPRMVVGRPATETLTLTGGATPSALQWVRDGSVVPPAALGVRSTPYSDSGGTGLRLTFTLTPMSVNELVVLNVNEDPPASDGRSFVAVGNISGACSIVAAGA
jgi:hypothetical protein